MKHLFYVFISTLFLFSCPDDSDGAFVPIPVQEIETVVNEFNLNIDGETESLSFECASGGVLYVQGIATDQTTKKLIYDQGFNSITLPSGSEFIYRVIFFTDMDLNRMDATTLSAWINNNKDDVHFEIEIKDENKRFKNQFYELDNLNPLYTERNIVAENETFDFNLGEATSLECLDNNEIIYFDISYSAVIKTQDEMTPLDVNLDFGIHLRTWK